MINELKTMRKTLSILDHYESLLQRKEEINLVAERLAILEDLNLKVSDLGRQPRGREKSCNRLKARLEDDLKKIETIQRVQAPQGQLNLDQLDAIFSQLSTI